MYENHFDPDLVKKIILSFQNVSGSYRIDGIKLLDKDKNQLL